MPGGYRDKDKNRENRPSWREIDKRKDRSHHTGDQKKGPAPKTRESMKQQYKKAVDELLFSGKPPESPQEKKARELLHKKYDTPGFDAAIKKFVKKYGIPNYWETLSMMLDCEDHEIKQATISAMAEMYEEQSKSEQMLFANSLRRISRLRDNEDTAKLARQQLKKLS